MDGAYSNQFTVEDALACPILKEAAVLTGHGSLSRTIARLTVGEVPDLPKWLKGGELVLSTLYALSEDPQARLEFVRELDKVKVAALLLKPGRFLGQVDKEILQYAEKRKFPLIQVPDNLLWSEIIREIYEAMLGNQLRLLEKSTEMHKSLLQVVMAGQGWSSLAEATSKLLSRPVVLADGEGKVVASSGMDIPEIIAMPKPGKNVSKMNDLYALPVLVAGEFLGAVFTTADQDLSELDLAVMEHASTVAALEFGKEEARLETEMRLRGDLFDDLLAGNIEDEQELLRRASFLNCDLRKGCSVILADIDNFTILAKRQRWDEHQIQRVREDFFRKTANFLHAYSGEVLPVLRSDSVVMIKPLDAEKNEHENDENNLLLARKLNHYYQNFDGYTVSLAISRPHVNPLNLRTAYQEASLAIQVNASLNRKGEIIHHDDIGAYKLLLKLWESAPGELENFCSETLGTLKDYDDKHNAELIKTLEMYLNKGENVADAAKDMYLHRHTVRYRLSRIGEITGLNVFNPEQRERLSLSLKALRILQTARK